ncbi:MAG: glycosyltransferase family 9 protein [Ignavibacteria bacterium]
MTEPIKKILIIQTAFLGDVVLALPMVYALKKLIPGSSIDFLCIPETSNVLENNPFIREAIRYDKKNKYKFKNLMKIIARVKKEKYDVVICPHRSLGSALITFFTNAEVRIGFDRNALNFLLTETAVYNYKQHEINRNLELVKIIPVTSYDEKIINLKPELFPSQKDILIAEKLLFSKTPTNTINTLIAFAPCSKWFTKQITLNKSADILKGLINSGYRAVIIGGSEDFEYCKELETRVNTGEDKLINLSGKLTPLQSSVVISKCAVLITTDSAAMHLGASTDTPMVVIYGSTSPAFGFYPLTSRNVIIGNNELTCRPCTDHGRKKCPLNHFKCIEDIPAEDIVNAVKKVQNRI